MIVKCKLTLKRVTSGFGGISPFMVPISLTESSQFRFALRIMICRDNHFSSGLMFYSSLCFRKKWRLTAGRSCSRL